MYLILVIPVSNFKYFFPPVGFPILQPVLYLCDSFNFTTCWIKKFQVESIKRLKTSLTEGDYVVPHL